jgi:hypothetical protein
VHWQLLAFLLVTVDLLCCESQTSTALSVDLLCSPSYRPNRLTPQACFSPTEKGYPISGLPSVRYRGCALQRAAPCNGRPLLTSWPGNCCGDLPWIRVYVRLLRTCHNITMCVAGIRIRTTRSSENNKSSYFLSVHIEYLIRHGTQRKHRVQSFIYAAGLFVAAGTIVSSRCVATGTGTQQRDPISLLLWLQNKENGLTGISFQPYWGGGLKRGRSDCTFNPLIAFAKMLTEFGLV